MININPVTIIAGIFLLAMMLFDLKGKKIPAILGTTGILACVLLVLWKNPISMLFGIAGFIFAYLLYEFGTFQGIADIKAITLIGLTIASLREFMLFMLLVGILGVIYHFIFSKVFKIKLQEDIPLIPMFFLIWMILMLV